MVTTRPDPIRSADRALAGATGNFLNPQYPTSWWAIGFSDEIGGRMATPNRVLERNVVLWRDGTGNLHCHDAICPHLGANLGFGGEVVDGSLLRCPFHGMAFDSQGVSRRTPDSDASTSARCRIAPYIVEEHNNEVFLWNGPAEPDHPVPDLVARVAARSGVAAEEVQVHRHAFFLPYPAKFFIENGPDASHLQFVHRIGAGCTVEVLEESAHHLRWIARVHDVESTLKWSRITEMVRRGELANLVSSVPDIEMTLFGGGLQTITFHGRTKATGRLAQLTRTFERAEGLLSWTPVSADSNILRFTIAAPKVDLPLIGPAFDALGGWLVKRRDWAGTMQDNPIMVYRDERPNPAYVRSDHAFVKFRRLWDSRIADRSLWEGDGIHSNGLRAGIRWPDAPRDRDGHGHGDGDGDGTTLTAVSS